MSIFTIKIIACISMILDHIKYVIPDTTNFMTLYLGRIAFPLFAFLITEGYIHTNNLKKYYTRLFIFAIISQIPFMLFRTLVGEYMMLNIMFTLLFGLLTITIYDKIEDKFISIILCIFVILAGKFLRVDYGWYGVTVVLLFYILRKKTLAKIISFAILVGFNYYLKGLFNVISNQIILYFVCTTIPIIFICVYNGKQGRKMKYFFYWFYPIHLLLFYLINFFFVK